MTDLQYYVIRTNELIKTCRQYKRLIKNPFHGVRNPAWIEQTKLKIKSLDIEIDERLEYLKDKDIGDLKYGIRRR